MFKTLIAVIALMGLTTSSALAAVLAEGRPSNGYYWQKVQKDNGTIQYMCRSLTSGKIQKGTSCESAGATKP